MTRTLPLALTFFAVSTVFSMIGMGGGILYVPILLFEGFTIQEAPVISLILIMATSSAALFTFWRNHKVDWKLALVLDPLTDLMAFVGGYASSLVSTVVLESILTGVLLIAGLLMLTSRMSPAGTAVKPSRWHWLRVFDGVEYVVHLPLVLTISALIGLLSGMIGITGGVIKLPIMVLLCGVPMDIAVATSTVMVAITAASGLVGHAIHQAVPWGTGSVLALASLTGGLLGSRLSLSAHKSQLRRMFGVVLLLIAFRFAVKLAL